MAIRELQHTDLDIVLALNNASVPAVNELDAAALVRLVDMSAAALAADVDGRLAGFCIVLPPGVDYGSDNYAWFSRHATDFAYLDRIAVDPSARRLGVGRAFYDELIARLSRTFPVLFCEVNLRPRNDVSLAFHASIGFREIGRQDTDGGTKTVSLLELPLPG